MISAQRLRVPEVIHLERVTSTMDEAHARATQGAVAGTLIVADEQTAGRGRAGRSWESQRAHGIWLTLIERPHDAQALDVLSIRLGLAIANAIEPFAPGPVSVKWPNDLYVGPCKLGGILVEARWRQGSLDWVAIGVGLNLREATQFAASACLVPGTSRDDVLSRMVPSMRDAAHASGHLSNDERHAWLARDISVGRLVDAPIPGRVCGLAQDGALLVERSDATTAAIRAGSLVFSAGASFNTQEEPC